MPQHTVPHNDPSFATVCTRKLLLSAIGFYLLVSNILIHITAALLLATSYSHC